MTYTEIQDAVTKLDLVELQTLERFVRARVHFASGGGSTARASGFKTGDLVIFNARGPDVQARVQKVNSKTLSVAETTAPFKKWRVSPSLCRLVGADRTPVSAAITAATPAPHEDIDTVDKEFIPLGATSAPCETAVGMGTW